VRPHPRQPRQQILELRQLHLHARFTRARTRSEDIKDELCAIHHARAHDLLDVLSLRRRELVIKNDQRGAKFLNAKLELLYLPRSQIRPGVRPVELLRQGADDLRTGRIGKAPELFEMLVNGVLRRTALERRADEDRPFNRRREIDWLATDETLPILKNHHRPAAASDLPF